MQFVQDNLCVRLFVTCRLLLLSLVFLCVAGSVRGEVIYGAVQRGLAGFQRTDDVLQFHLQIQ